MKARLVVYHRSIQSGLHCLLWRYEYLSLHYTGVKKKKALPLLPISFLIQDVYGMVITYSKSTDQPGKVVNPACSQLNRENGYFPVRVRA